MQNALGAQCIELVREQFTYGNGDRRTRLKTFWCGNETFHCNVHGRRDVDLPAVS